ncbi:flavodoxin family protein [Primorskyibacter aestuariivivens]|uniref:flavodoxin family protein n=1 Tax=Primorskyibacter aestuariivivens TaxID=1888912 RepID=UPI002300E2D5|nr:flavodoxin family protein [Primorskyibacter aestuariivivens]MDA7428057.1 flavodoxin family protein [Primorskyibacter aestuariivivens]
MTQDPLEPVPLEPAPICLPYFTGAGHTARLAQGIAAGIGAPRLIDVTEMTSEDWDALDAAPAIVFGAPTYMGSTAARFDMFLEDAASRWDSHGWTDKIAAGFTVATHGSGDKLAALQRMAVYSAQMGMIWVGQAAIGAPVKPKQVGINRDGSWLGLMATSSRDKSRLIEAHDLETARRFGKRIAAAADRWGQR